MLLPLQCAARALIPFFIGQPVVCCCNDRHRRFGIVGKCHISGDLNPFDHRCIKCFKCLPRVHRAVYFNIKILSVTCDPNAERCGEGHDLVRGIALRIADVDLRAADCLLKITHKIQVSEELHRAEPAEFNSYLHSRHLREILLHRSRNSACGS